MAGNLGACNTGTSLIRAYKLHAAPGGLRRWQGEQQVLVLGDLRKPMGQEFVPFREMSDLPPPYPGTEKAPCPPGTEKAPYPPDQVALGLSWLYPVPAARAWWAGRHRHLHHEPPGARPAAGGQAPVRPAEVGTCCGRTSCLTLQGYTPAPCNPCWTSLSPRIMFGPDPMTVTCSNCQASVTTGAPRAPRGGLSWYAWSFLVLVKVLRCSQVF